MTEHSSPDSDLIPSSTWAQLLTVLDVMKSAHSKGGDRLMSIWTRDIEAVEAAVAALSHPSVKPDVAQAASLEPCPYAEDGMECLLETHSFGPCLCANPVSAPPQAVALTDLQCWKDGQLVACDLPDFIRSLRRYAGWADEQFATRSDAAAHLGERLSAAISVIIALSRSFTPQREHR